MVEQMGILMVSSLVDEKVERLAVWLAE